MQPERVFIDTNILVSAIVFGGNPRKLIDLALGGRITLVLSDFVVREARRVVAAKFPSYAHRLEWELAILDYEMVSDVEPSLFAQAAGLVRDPGDVEVLAAILAAKPDVALTGDKDLLTDEVKAVAPTRRCAEYLESLEREE